MENPCVPPRVGCCGVERLMWESVVAQGNEVRFAAGDVLMHHGDASHHCYAIRCGEVLVTASTMQGLQPHLGRRGPGDLVGELGVLGGSTRSATVRARTDVEAVALSADGLAELFRSDPEVALAWTRWLAHEYRTLTERFAVRSEDLRTRILQLLGTNAEVTGDPTFRSTREELAGWVGATREAASRTLRDLEEDGLVALSRGGVRLVLD